MFIFLICGGKVVRPSARSRAAAVARRTNNQQITEVTATTATADWTPASTGIRGAEVETVATGRVYQPTGSEPRDFISAHPQVQPTHALVLGTGESLPVAVVTSIKPVDIRASSSGSGGGSGVPIATVVNSVSGI